MEGPGATWKGRALIGGRGVHYEVWSWDSRWSRIRSIETTMHGGLRLASSGGSTTASSRRNELRRNKGRQGRLRR